MAELIFTPEKVRGIELISERFEVDSDMPELLIKVIARKVGERAIERYTKLRKWRFVNDSAHPVTLDLSDLQLDLTDHQFATHSKTAIAVDSNLMSVRRGITAYVLKMYFETDLIPVVLPETPEEDYGHKEGFLKEDELYKDVPV